MPIETVSLSQEVNPRVRGLFLKNLGDFQTELARVIAGFIPSLIIWRQRKELPALVFRSLRRVQDLRQRGRELGVSFEEMHFSANVAGRAVIDKLCAANNPADLLQAGIIVVHGVVIAAIEDYLKRNEGVYDLPSVALLEADRDELKSQLAWAQAALDELAEDADIKPRKNFVDEITELCAALPAALRAHNVRGLSLITQSRRLGVLPWAEAKLPLGFRHLECGPEPLPKNPAYADRERYHAVNFLQEVQAADSCASMLFESPDMPWPYFFDL